MAVPVQASRPAGYLTELQLDGTGPQARLSGYPAKNADVKIRVKTAGPVAADDLEADAAEIEIKAATRNGAKPRRRCPRMSSAIRARPCSSARGDILVAGDVYSFQHACLSGRWKEPATARARFIEVAESGQGVLAAAELVIRITKGGGRNEGSFQLSIDGGDNYQKARTIPVNGEYPL